MRLVTAAEAKRLDARAAAEFGIPTLLLMENAGLSIVLAMEKMFGSLEGKRITIFCGRGGNGGDGMCAARHLVAHGAQVVVGLVGGRDGLKGDALSNWTILDRMGLTPVDVRSDGDLAWVKAASGAAELIVDALVGVGARLPLDGLMGAVIASINASAKPVVSVDLPSGLEPDTGRVPGAAVIATQTVTLGLPKRGLVLHPGTAWVGKLVVADLTFPIPLLTDPAIMADVLLPEEALQLLPVRSPTAHKHEVGRVLLVAGSRSMPGAALLAGQGALRSGAGMVHVATPASAVAALSGRIPELLVRSSGESGTGGLAESSVDELLAFAAGMHAVGVGPGLGREEGTRRSALRLIRDIAAPMVVDADGLFALGADLASLKAAKGPRVLTPHAGELSRLLGGSSEVIEADRIGSAAGASARSGAVVVLKGARTVVAEPAGRCWIVSTGNAGMATAGSGDVLTGIIAALLAQRLPASAAALLGCHLHGLAGDLARDEKTELGLIASDLAGFLPAALRRLRGGETPGNQVR